MINKSSCTVLLLSGLLFLDGKAANDPVPSPVRVSEVTFSQGTAITNDDASAMDSPHWVDQVNKADSSDQFPDSQPDEATGVAKPNDVKSYAYSSVSNKKPKVKAVFKWKNPPDAAAGPYKAKGKVVDTANSGFTLPEQELTNDTDYAAKVSPENIVTDRKIQAYVTDNRNIARNGVSGLKPPTIEWTVTDNNGKEVGTSKSTHTIYVTWDEPVTDLRQETLFNLACETANGMAVGVADKGKAVFEKIWTEFSDREVKRMDGTAMKYWGVNITANLDDAAKLIEEGDGSCGRWASFLEQCNLVNGIAVQRKQIGPKVTAANGIAPTQSLMIVAQYNSLVTGPYPKQMQNPNTQLTLVKKAPGQANANPSADRFPGHLVNSFDGGEEIFDPSYGNRFNVLTDWETGSLSFVLRQYDSVNDQGQASRFFVIFDRINNNTITSYPSP